jgi:Asp-tRNA(Asn)/Glu-tRNA(Gln) amidotransferase A subunit family amidase
MLDNFVPPYSATVVENMAAAGCISLGKTNMDEFAMGSSNETSFYGAVTNPWDTRRVPGGSSGGGSVDADFSDCAFYPTYTSSVQATSTSRESVNSRRLTGL